MHDDNQTTNTDKKKRVGRILRSGVGLGLIGAGVSAFNKEDSDKLDTLIQLGDTLVDPPGYHPIQDLKSILINPKKSLRNWAARPQELPSNMKGKSDFMYDYLAASSDALNTKLWGKPVYPILAASKKGFGLERVNPTDYQIKHTKEHYPSYQVGPLRSYVHEMHPKLFSGDGEAKRKDLMDSMVGWLNARGVNGTKALELDGKPNISSGKQLSLLKSFLQDYSKSNPGVSRELKDLEVSISDSMPRYAGSYGRAAKLHKLLFEKAPIVLGSGLLASAMLPILISRNRKKKKELEREGRR